MRALVSLPHFVSAYLLSLIQPSVVCSICSRAAHAALLQALHLYRLYLLQLLNEAVLARPPAFVEARSISGLKVTKSPTAARSAIKIGLFWPFFMQTSLSPRTYAVYLMDYADGDYADNAKPYALEILPACHVDCVTPSRSFLSALRFSTYSA